MLINYSLSDKGLKRLNNEDAIYTSSLLTLVSDGMGGHEKGEVASSLIIEEFTKIFDDKKKIIDTDIEKLISNTIKNSHQKITQYAKENSITTTIGATLVGLLEFKHSKLAVFHLGDSRLYRIRNKKIEALTTDHSVYEEMLKTQKYTQEEMSRIKKNKITKAVGNFPFIEPEINFLDAIVDDIYMLCSDGVSDLCSDEELYQIVVKNRDDLKKATIEIKELVYSQGAKDNLSIILSIYN